MNQYLNNPFLWAFLSMFTMVGACSVVGSRKIGSHPALGWIIVTILSLGRIILVLPSVDQPRFFLNGLNAAIGISIFVIGLFFALGPCFNNNTFHQEKYFFTRVILTKYFYPGIYSPLTIKEDLERWTNKIYSVVPRLKAAVALLQGTS